MFNEDMKSMMDLFANPIFRKGFLDFFQKMQQEGIEEAKKAWNVPNNKFNLLPNTDEFYEKMVDFYSLAGFVPRAKHDELIKENEDLKKENAFLKDAIKELQLNLFREGSEKAQQAWQTIVDKQLEMNKEFTTNFFEQFKKMGKKEK